MAILFRVLFRFWPATGTRRRCCCCFRGIVCCCCCCCCCCSFWLSGGRGEGRERERVRFFLIRRSWTRSRSLSTAAVDRAARGDSAGQSSTSPAAGRSAAPRERRIRQNKRRKTNADTHTIEPKGEHVRRHQSAHGRHGRRPLRGNRQLHLCSSDRKST